MANGDTRSFLIQFMAETGDAVTAMNWLGRSMKQFPSQAISAAAETEAAMAQVDTALKRAGASANDLVNSFALMGRDVTDMMRTSGVAAKMGLEGAENLVKFSEVARKFGMVTGKSAEQAGMALSDVGIAMGYTTPEQIEKLASGMAVLTRSTKITTDELVALMGRTGPLSKAVGVSESAVMGLATSFSQQNMKAGQITGTIGNLMNLMQQMQISGINLGHSLKGLSFEEFAKFEKADPGKQMEMFMEHLGKMKTYDAVQQIEGMGIATGQTAWQMVLAAQQSKNLSTYIGWASDAMKKNTKLNSEANKVEKTLTFQLKEMGRQLKAIFVVTGKMLLPVVRFFVEALRGFLFVVVMIPRPVLALAAAFAALGSAILLGAWASKTKLLTGSISLIASLYREIAAVGGLTGAYKALTSAQAVQAVVQTAARRRSELAAMSPALRAASLAAVPKGGMALGGFGTAGAAATGQVGLLTMAAGALGISLGWLIVIILAVVAALVVMGVMIYKGVKMFREGEGKVKAFGAALLVAAGPIGVFVLGMMLMEKHIKKFKEEMMKAIEPLIPLLKEMTPLIYAVGAAIAMAISPLSVQVVALLFALYTLMPFLVGFTEAFVEIVEYAIEPIRPGLKVVSDLFDRLALSIGFATGGTGEMNENLKRMGRIFAWLVLGTPARALRYLGIVCVEVARFFMNLAKAWGVFVLLFDVTVARVRSAFDRFVSRVRDGIMKIVDPLVRLRDFFANVIDSIVSGMDRVLAPVRAVAASFYAIMDAVRAVKGSIFSSSALGIKEGFGEVIPNLEDTRRGFDDIAEASIGVPRMAEAGGRGVLPPTVPAMAAMAAMRVPTAAPEAPAMGAGEGQREIRVSIPVVVQLDGLTLGRAVVEQIIELGERNMNPPGFPMRGVEPAFG